MPFVNKERRWSTIGLVLLVVFAGCAGGGAGGGGDAARDARTGSAGAGGGSQAAERASGGPGAASGSFYLGEDRIVVREASMTVVAEEFDPAFDRARAITREHGGFVADWELDVERGWHVANLQIRVPSENFNEVRDGLAGLGDVRRERVEARDFTSRHDDLGAELSDLREREQELAALLREESNERRTRQIRRELADVRESIRERESDRASLERRDALSTIQLSLREPEGARPPQNAEVAAGFDAAFLTAFYAGLVVVKYALALVGFAIPVGLVLAGFGITGVVSARFVRRAWTGLDAGLARLGLDPVADSGTEGREE